MYQYIFFDMDGTLTDSREGITKSVQYALAHMGIQEPDLVKLERFIGPPLIDSFMDYYGFTREQAVKATDYFQEYFSVYGIYQNKLYEGITELLLNLRKHDKVLAVASCKPEVHVKKILKYFEIDGLFTEVCGSVTDSERSRKEEVIEELLDRLGLSRDVVRTEKNVLMVGDRKHDVEGAAVFGIPCLGLSIGFAEEGELEKAGAAAVVQDLKEAEAFILQG